MFASEWEILGTGFTFPTSSSSHVLQDSYLWAHSVKQRVHDKRKTVLNMSMHCVECVQKVSHLECLFNEHFKMCYQIQASPSKYNIIIMAIIDIPDM